MTFNGSSGYLSSPLCSVGSPNTFSRGRSGSSTTTTTRRQADRLREPAETGTSGTYHRHVYLTDDGRLYFGVYSGGNRDGRVDVAATTTARAPRRGHPVHRPGCASTPTARLVGSDLPGTTTGEPGQ